MGQGQKNGLLFLALESTQLISVLPRLMRRNTNYVPTKYISPCYIQAYVLQPSKSTFLSEDTDVFVIFPNRWKFYFPELENLNFGKIA